MFYFCFHPLTIVEEAIDLRQIPHPVILAYNHNNYYETIVISSYLVKRWPRRRVSFVVDWMFGRLPLIGWFLQAVEPVYVYHKPARWQFLNRRKPPRPGNKIQECLQRLAVGASVGIFPEGSRNGDPAVLRRGRRGIGELALLSQVPVLPVGIDFPARQYRGRIPVLGRIILRFGHLLQFPMEATWWQRAQAADDWPPAERQSFYRYLCRRITYQIMQELAKLSGKQYPYCPPPRPALWPPL